jgi:very-short-patch-repair endonuclease
MKKFGVPRREGNQPKPFSYDELYELYVAKRLSTRQIANLKGCVHATVLNCLRRLGIKLRRQNHKGRKVNVTDRVRENLKKARAKRWSYLKENPPFTKEELRGLYLEEGLGTREIAEMKNTNHRRVLSWMRRYGIKGRSISEAQRKYIKFHPKRLQEMVLALRKGCRHPNKSEKRLRNLLFERAFPFQYTGNGSFVIGGLCPDFVNLQDKRVIELFGDYWHKPEEEEGRKKAFAEFGYETLIIWEHELQDENAVLTKIESWIGG